MMTGPRSLPRVCTRNFLTFVNTTAIAYGQKIDKSLRILVSCNSSCVHKRQKITSRDARPLSLGNPMLPLLFALNLFLLIRARPRRLRITRAED